MSDNQHDHPLYDTNADPALDAIGRFLLGLADMLHAIIERLREFGLALMERAAPAGDAQ